MAQSTKKQSLGKGIRALLNTIDDEISASPEGVPAASGQNGSNSLRIPLELIEINPKQPRRDFDENLLEELAESIKTHDIIQPITVVRVGQNKFQLIAGERRLRASKIAGLKDIPAYIRTVEDYQMLELALIENLQRQDLNPIEIAISYRQLIEECGLTQEALSERMNKERSTVTNYLRLLKLPPDIQKAVRDGMLSMGHARAIIGLEHVEQQLYTYRQVLELGLSVRQTEKMVKDVSEEKTKQTEKQTEPQRLPQAYRKIEENMASHFSTKVQLQRKKNGRGVISIDFYNDEDLERIMEKMSL